MPCVRMDRCAESYWPCDDCRVVIRSAVRATTPFARRGRPQRFEKEWIDEHSSPSCSVSPCSSSGRTSSPRNRHLPRSRSRWPRRHRGCAARDDGHTGARHGGSVGRLRGAGGSVRDAHRRGHAALSSPLRSAGRGLVSLVPKAYDRDDGEPLELVISATAQPELAIDVDGTAGPQAPISLDQTLFATTTSHGPTGEVEEITFTATTAEGVGSNAGIASIPRVSPSTCRRA